MDIRRGDRLVVRSGFGSLLDRRAITGVEMGQDFLVVWVATEEEWEAAKSDGREPIGDPWPVEDVKLAEEAASLQKTTATN